MIVFMLLIYAGLLFLLMKIGLVPKTKAAWLSIIRYSLLILIAFVVPMQWGAPSGNLGALTYSVAITPNVSGEVIEVPVKPNVPLKKGDVLFRIDPTQYQASIDNLMAQMQLAELRLDQARELLERNVGSDI